MPEVDSLFLVRSDLRPSLVSFLSCLEEMTVADVLVLPADLPVVLGMAVWRNHKIPKVRQLLVPHKMAELHELQPVLQMHMMLKARPHPLDCMLQYQHKPLFNE